MAEQTDYKRIPYGISDFRQLREEGKYYVDKTMYLPRMEEVSNFIFCIRPRRFGKSVLLSMMRYYYDVNERDNFSRLFEGLWIAEHPTPLQGGFEVLHLDFSQVTGGSDNIYEGFDQYMSVKLDSFAETYAERYPEDFVDRVKAYTTFNGKLDYIIDVSKKLNHKKYLILDEYDNFTNNILNEKGQEVYHALTHATGFYRDVFKKFKGNFDRIFMIGVSPVTMDDVTSGFNIALNISTDPWFNMMLGFSEEDVRQMIRYYRGVGAIEADEETLIADMKPWYDNYCFSERRVMKDPKMFNSDMVLYYLNNVIRMGEAPEQMVDNNTRTDYTKMRRLLLFDQMEKSEDFHGPRRSALYRIAQDGEIRRNVKSSFPADRIADRDNFVSLLFYYGMLTYGEPDGAMSRLIIPNNNVRKQYYDYLLQGYNEIAHVDTAPLEEAFGDAALRGEWEPMMRLIGEAYEKNTSVRQLIEGERNIQGFMNAMLSLNPYYLTAPEVELNHGYCDFFLMPDFMRWPMVKHSYILELKYLKADATDADAESQWREAVEQIEHYAEGPSVRRLCHGTALHSIVAQFHGYKLTRLEQIHVETL